MKVEKISEENTLNSEYAENYSDEFFIIDSQQLDSVIDSKLFGFSYKFLSTNFGI